MLKVSDEICCDKAAKTMSTASEIKKNCSLCFFVCMCDSDAVSKNNRETRQTKETLLTIERLNPPKNLLFFLFFLYPSVAAIFMLLHTQKEAISICSSPVPQNRIPFESALSSLSCDFSYRTTFDNSTSQNLLPAQQHKQYLLQGRQLRVWP